METLVEELRFLAWDKCTTPARVALAWLQTRGGTGDITLSNEEIRRLNAIAPAGFAAGTRYPEPLMAALNR